VLAGALGELAREGAGAEPLVLSLLDAGFVETAESIGPMNSYLVSLRRDDLTVAPFADRGQWWIEVQAPNPVPGRGRPGVVRAEIEVYMAALRHDVTTDALFGDLATRAEKGAAGIVTTRSSANGVGQSRSLSRSVRSN
jgi:hypothetical protein